MPGEIRLNNIKNFSNNILLFITSLLIFLSILETTLRINEYIIEKQGAKSNHFKYDPLLGWAHKPGLSTTLIARGKYKKYAVNLKFNSEGLRGPEYPYTKKQGEYRILILGDSFAEGDVIEFKNLFSEELKRKLNKNLLNYYEVINAGVCGYSTDQELLFFVSRGRKYNPDLTILMIFYNDVWFNTQTCELSGYHKPMFVIKGDDILLTNVPVHKSGSIGFGKNPEQTKLEAFEKIKTFLLTHSNSYRLAIRLIKSNSYLLKLAIKLRLARRPALPEDLKVFRNKLDSSAQYAFKLTELLMTRLKKEVNSINSELLVFYVPYPAVIYEDFSRYYRENCLLDNDNGLDFSKPGVILEKICKKNNIDYLNPAELFIKKMSRMQKDKGMLYIARDGHWNVEGHKFVGEILTDYIKNHYLDN